MQRIERTQVVEHRIGAAGTLSLKGVAGPIRIHGTDGETARVTVTYRVRAADEAAADAMVEELGVEPLLGEGWLEIDTRERPWSRFEDWLHGDGRERGWPRLDLLGALVGAGNVRIALDVQAPRGASVQVDTVSGDIDVREIAGEQRYRAVSGELRIDDGGGHIDASTVSGPVDVAATSDVALQARTVSGNVRLVAPRITAVHVTTTSGEVRLAGPLAPGGEHRVSSLSGRLAVESEDVTVAMKTVSGSVHCAVPHRQESRAGRQLVIVGPGAARLEFDSMSGGLDVAGRAPAGTPSRDAAASEEAATPVAGSDAESAAPVDPKAQLDILRALERGEIGVDEAADRLALAGSGVRGGPDA